MKKKKTLALLAAAAMCSTTLLYYPAGIFAVPLPTAAEGDVEINAVNFPDETFRTYVDENFDTTDDDMLTVEEIAAVTEINFYSAGITTVSDLTGVAYFTALTYLDCSSNQLTSLDVSQNTMLEYLDCGYNPLLALNGVSDTLLICSVDSLAAAELLTASVTLKDYGIVEESISDLTDGTITDGVLTPDADKVTYTYACGSGETIACTIQFGITVNEANFPDEAFRTYVSNSFDTDADGILTIGEIAAVTTMTAFDMGITDLTGVAYFTALTRLDCYGNQLKSLDVSKNSALTHLYCHSNQLTSLDVSKNTALTDLYCASNQLTSLDVSENTALTNLNCASNQLTSLDVSKNTALNELYCLGNQLT
ncbi:MAG: leucine-rich repeat domain-containing protein, partial [Oscillospiraceae bacterium]|nr:leucine-rich repeat domain-containing protein [Oscillospiraceae bacterium]